MKYGRFVFYVFAIPIIGILSAMLIPVSHVGTSARNVMCRTEISGLKTALDAYRDKFGNYPTGESSNIVSVLAGDNPQKIVFLNFRRIPERPNEMVDPWGTPYQIKFFEQTNFIISSAGKNKIFGSADDIIFNSVSNDFVKP